MSKKSNRTSARRKSRSISTLVVLVGIAVLAVLVIIVVVLSLTPFTSTGGTPGGTPKFLVSTERLDFGKQIFNHPVHASFTIQNVGTSTLTLQVPRQTTLIEGC